MLPPDAHLDQAALEDVERPPGSALPGDDVSGVEGLEAGLVQHDVELVLGQVGEEGQGAQILDVIGSDQGAVLSILGADACVLPGSVGGELGALLQHLGTADGERGRIYPRVEEGGQLGLEDGDLGRSAGEVLDQAHRSLVEVNGGEGEDANAPEEVPVVPAGLELGPDHREAGELRIVPELHVLGL